jgi:hypothetical protein
MGTLTGLVGVVAPEIGVGVEVDRVVADVADVVGDLTVVIISPVGVPPPVLLHVFCAERVNRAVVMLPHIIGSEVTVCNLALGIEWHELMLGEGLALVN